MSLKVYDGQGRWQSKAVAFRLAPEKNADLDIRVKLSGLTKQDYLIRRFTERDIIVVGNPWVFKTLRNQMAAVLAELQRIAVGRAVDSDLLETVNLIAIMMGGLKEESN